MAEEHTIQFNSASFHADKVEWERRIRNCLQTTCWCSDEPIAGLQYSRLSNIVRVLHPDGTFRHTCSFSGELTEKMRQHYNAKTDI